MGKSSAWLVDANNIKIKDFSASDLESFIIRTNEIDLFLSSSDANKFFIVGPKGLGKTLLLKLKSLQLREKGYKALPENVLCEKLDAIHEHFTYNEIRDLETERMWEIIWEISISCWILVSCNLEVPEEIKNVFGKATSLSSILKNFLRINTKNIEKLHRKYNDKEIRPVVDELQKYGISQIALFIDNVDEALSDYVGEKFRLNDDKSYLVSDKIWVKAQISLLSLSKRLMHANPHLKIFLSIRSEAYNQIVAAEKTQIDDLCIQLKYTKDQIKEIFIKNIKETDNDMLVFPKEDDHIKSFIGFTSIPHRLIKDQAGDSRLEDIFDYIFRHTFGRPREIIVMGNKIYNIDPKNRNVDTIRNTVNEVSSKLFEQFTLEIVPYFDLKQFTEFCKEVRKNVFTYNTAERVYNLFRDKEGVDHICSYYWNLGLLGVVNQSRYNNGELAQTFQPVGQYALSNNRVPEHEFFLLHPATYSIMEPVLYDIATFYDLDNIVGYNNAFVKPRIPHNGIRYHLQLGLDRDTLSILIPTIYKFKVLAILINPSDNHWNDIRESDAFSLDVNGDFFHFEIYRDDLSDYKKKRIYKNWLENQKSTLFYTDNNTLIDDIVNISNTISLTDYNNAFFQNISTNSNNQNKIIYLCKKTFDKDLNKKFSKTLIERFSNWTFRLVLIDRYTLSVTKVLQTGNFYCKVITEDYAGKQVSIFHNQASILPSNIVQRPKSEDEFNLFVKEFELLREGVYQYYKYLRQTGVIRNSSLDCFDRLKLFLQLQVEGLIGPVDKNILKEVYAKDIKPELRKDLMEQGIAHLDRLDKLDKFHQVITGTYVNISGLKQKGIVINDKTFYQTIKHTFCYYTNPKVITDLMSDIKVSHLPSKYSSVFISYSFKDSKFATLLASYLIINGVKVDIFEFDDPRGNLKGIMADYVKNNDKMIFVSSINSIKSEACHFELENYRTKASKLWDISLIPIMLDRFILDVNNYSIPPNQRDLFWENIKFIKEFNIQDFTSYSQQVDNFHLEADIMHKIVEKYLKK